MRRRERLPEAGAALMVGNHVSFVDALVISAACPRPIRFIMDNAIFCAPLIRTLAHAMHAIPIASAKDDAAIYERAFEMAATALRRGKLVRIFLEGRLAADGQMAPFRPGLSRIVEANPVPVIAMAIEGLWGSMFSRQFTKLWQRLPRKLWHRVIVNVGSAVPPREAAPETLPDLVRALYLAAENS